MKYLGGGVRGVYIWVVDPELYKAAIVKSTRQIQLTCFSLETSSCYKNINK